jgi:hypothetical protein
MASDVPTSIEPVFVEYLYGFRRCIAGFHATRWVTLRSLMAESLHGLVKCARVHPGTSIAFH